MPLVLHGYRYSVYVRIARLALAEKGVAYDRVEVNPFAPDVPAAYLALHPFGRVPTLVHDDFALYETGAITRYLDRTFAGPALQPRSPRALARMDQIIGVVDSYGYWPLVRQVFSQRVFRPAIGQPADEAEVGRGLAVAQLALQPVAQPRGLLVVQLQHSLAVHLGGSVPTRLGCHRASRMPRCACSVLRDAAAVSPGWQALSASSRSSWNASPIGRC